MLKIYGHMQCPDCQNCRADLDRAEVDYEYLDFAVSLRNLKGFLDIREKNPEFDAVRERGSIGIPCIIREDGSVTFSWDEFV